MDADALYALAPEDFTAARDAAAKQARADGDADAAKALKALRRPSVAAWVVNRLAVDQRPLLDELLALGPALAQAQASGQADELRALGRQRRELVEAVTDAAAGAVDRPVTTAVREEVASTLEAALSDPASAEAVRSGRLVRALSYAGFGGVDLAGAVAEPAGPPPVPRKGKREEEERAVAAAERAAHEASGHLDDAVRAADRAERARTDAAAALDDAERVVAHARAALEAAEHDRDTAAQARQDASAAAEQAVGAVQAAQKAAEAARSELDRLRRS